MSLLLLFAGAGSAVPAAQPPIVAEGGPMGYGPTIRGMRDIQAWRDRLEDEEIALITIYLAT